ncbi:hypothetical protein [Rhodococcoides kyotonense]|uniref:DUF5709 domain-containing protein n=1 Tax=Rhodococcoides kyotonense TaxID=398843 RepID=A0A239MH50_9NOCA|nr:hypothetical protein [Rhodococcus kyotonensis]SNT41830.1 hypothetical protein SAMN05421642_11827 [Rhodococcus kyotonensis]
MSIEDGQDQTLDQSESLDSDEVRNDDGDTIVEPPEHWSEADKFGTTPEEALEGESLDEKLSEEEPDVALESDERAVADTPDDELTEEQVDHEILESDEDPDIDYADGQRQAEIIEGTLVEDRGRDRGQIGGTPEDGGPVE